VDRVSEALCRGARICFVARALRPQIVKRERLRDHSLVEGFCISRCQFARKPDSEYGLPSRLQIKVARRFGPSFLRRSMTARSSGDHSTMTVFAVSTIFPCVDGAASIYRFERRRLLRPVASATV